MSRVRLAKVVRKSAEALGPVLALSPGEVHIVDARGRVLLGEAEVHGTRRPLGDAGAPLGFVVGDGPVAEAVAGLVERLVASEAEKLGLAEETLGRYKELSLLYGLSEELSQQIDSARIAAAVVDHACRHLRADGAVIALQDPGGAGLRTIGAQGDGGPSHHADTEVSGLAGRVLATGQAEFVESRADGTPAGICAPLRSGERVFGVLEVWQRPPSTWVAGDLKLVAALAANAAGALTNARAQEDRLREMELRLQVDHLVPRQLVEAVSDGAPMGAGDAVVVLVDLNPHRGDADVLDAFAALDIADHRRVITLSALVGAGAVVDAPLPDQLVAVFSGRLGENAAVVARALGALSQAWADAAAAGVGRPGGAGLAMQALPDAAVTDPLRDCASRAARLLARAQGRVLVEASVAALATDAVLGSASPEPPLNAVEVLL